jgi:hypothetical protein
LGPQEFTLRFSLRALVLTVLATVVFVSPVFAQGLSVESKSPPSVVGAGPFVSLEGRFSIALPPGIHGFRPLSLDTPAGRLTGDAYNWTMKEGRYTAGFVNGTQSMENAEATATIFGNIRQGMTAWATSKNGKLIGERSVELDKHPGLEVKLEFPEAILWQRFYVVSSRLFQIVLVVSTDQRPYEAEAVKVLDSFKLLSEAEVAAAVKAKESAAEPSPLPQEPVAARDGSDAADDRLRGAVKTVLQESESLSGPAAGNDRKPSSMKYYNQDGNLTKQERYDYKGNLSEITVFGYLDGARVSNSKGIERPYNPPPIVMASPSGAPKPKSDPRYSNKFAFRYDSQKRLLEKTWFHSNGEVQIRYVYKYSGNQLEELVYAHDGSLNQRYIVVFDDKGNEIEQTSFETRDGSVRDKYSYTYEFDTKGNWTKRITSKSVTKDNKLSFEPAYAHYRTITYY